MSPIKDSSVLFIPYWMARVMRREKLSYNIVFNLFEMKKYYSVEDLAVLYWMNSRNSIFEKSDRTMERNIWTSEPEWKYIENNLIPMQALAAETLAQRMTPENSQITELQNERGVAYDIVSISDIAPVFVVIMHPSTNPEDTHALKTELLKLLYAHTGYDNMANSPLFKSYITKVALLNNAL